MKVTVWPIASALGILAVVVGGLALFILTMPLALALAVRWQFFGQAIVLDDAPTGLAALRMSGRAIQGRWLTILVASLVIQGLVILPGPIIGVILMVRGTATVDIANGLSSFVYAILLPIAQIALTLLYLRHADRDATAHVADAYRHGPSPWRRWQQPAGPVRSSASGRYDGAGLTTPAGR